MSYTKIQGAEEVYEFLNSRTAQQLKVIVEVCSHYLIPKKEKEENKKTVDRGERK